MRDEGHYALYIENKAMLKLEETCRNDLFVRCGCIDDASFLSALTMLGVYIWWWNSVFGMNAIVIVSSATCTELEVRGKSRLP